MSHTHPHMGCSTSTTTTVVQAISIPPVLTASEHQDKDQEAERQRNIKVAQVRAMLPTLPIRLLSGSDREIMLRDLELIFRDRTVADLHTMLRAFLDQHWAKPGLTAMQLQTRFQQARTDADCEAVRAHVAPFLPLYVSHDFTLTYQALISHHHRVFIIRGGYETLWQGSCTKEAAPP